MGDTFKGRYQVQDGYAGPSRPIHVKINADDLEDDMTDEDIENLYLQIIDDHFQEHISAGAERVEEFVVWAREQLNKRED